MEREYGLVLAGGGTKGAYQVGVWKALKELKINVKAIAGASIGSINGALFLQDDVDRAIEIYENIKITDIMEVSDKIDSSKDIFEISNLRQITREYLEKGGLENAPLRELLDKNIDVNKVYKSDIDYGLVTYSMKDRIPLELFKKDIPKTELIDFILASSCFPIFKAQKIGGMELVDGGFYDNAPTNMLINAGYIIIADVEGIGFNRKTIDRNVYIKVLSPSEDLGGLFNFNQEKIRKNILLGYLDTMRRFNSMEGNIYYFPNEEYFKFLKEFNTQEIRGLETAARIYKVDKYKPYDFEEFLRVVYEKHMQAKEEFEKIKDGIKSKNLREKLKQGIENDLVLCLAMDIYIDRPTAKKLKILQPYIEAVEGLLELENYFK